MQLLEQENSTGAARNPQRELGLSLVLNACNVLQNALCLFSLSNILVYMFSMAVSPLIGHWKLEELRSRPDIDEATVEAIIEEALQSNPFLADMSSRQLIPSEGDDRLRFFLGILAVSELYREENLITFFAAIALLLVLIRMLRSYISYARVLFVPRDGEKSAQLRDQLSALRKVIGDKVILGIGQRTAASYSLSGRPLVSLSIQDVVDLKKNKKGPLFKIHHEIFHLKSLDPVFYAISQPIAFVSSLVVALGVGAALLSMNNLIPGDQAITGLIVFVVSVALGIKIFDLIYSRQTLFLRHKELLADRYAKERAGRFNKPPAFPDSKSGRHPSKREREAYYEHGVADAPARHCLANFGFCFLCYFLPLALGLNFLQDSALGLFLVLSLVPSSLDALLTRPAKWSPGVGVGALAFTSTFLLVIFPVAAAVFGHLKWSTPVANLEDLLAIAVSPDRVLFLLLLLTTAIFITKKKVKI